MLRTSLKPHYVMGTLIALLLLVTAAMGLMVENIYQPFFSETIIAFQFFQDFVSLLVAPALVAAMLFASRGSQRALIIWSGLLIYVGYYYAFYVFDFVYNIGYPLYLALIGMSLYSLIGLITSIDEVAFAASVLRTMPVRLISLVLGSTLLFVPIWLMMLFKGIATRQAGDTDLVFVLDLAFLIPACLYAAVQIWQRRPIGFVLAGPLLLKATLSGLLLAGGGFMMSLQLGRPIAWDQMSLYLFLALMGAIALTQYMRNIPDSADKFPLAASADERSSTVSMQGAYRR